MLGKKPALPNNINPKNVALRLFFRDVLFRNKSNKIIEHEVIITADQLYRSGDVELACGSFYKFPVNIIYKNGFLSVKTTAFVDVHISGDIPARAVHIETLGDCLFFNGRFLTPSLKLYVAAKVVFLDIPVANARVIALLPCDKANSAVLLNKPITTDRLILDVNDLQLKSNLQVCKALVKCKQMHAAKHAELTLTSKPYSTLNFKDAFDKLHQQLMSLIDCAKTSEITVVDPLICEGAFNLNKTKLHCDSKIEFMPGSTANFSLVELSAKSLYVADKAIITGVNSTCKLLEDTKIDGKVSIDNFSISSENIDVSRGGILDGVSKLVLTPKKYLTVAGKVTSYETNVDSEYTIAKFGGIINGTISLNLSGMLSAQLFGGCLSGEKINNRSALNINLFGLVSGWYSSVDSLVGLEFGNLYLPYVDFATSGQDLYNTACINLMRMKDLQYTKTADLYMELYNLVPKTADEAWQAVASRAGIVRAMLSTVSTTANTVFCFSYQTIALINQLVRMNNMHQVSSFTNFADQSSKEMLALLLDLKGLMVSGNALQKNAITSYNNSDVARVKPSEAIVGLASLGMPVVQNDTLLDASAPLLSASWTETRQNWFSARGGYNAAWNQHEQTMFDQVDHSKRIAHNIAISAGRNRYYNGSTKYSGTMSIAATNYNSTLASRVKALRDGAQYSLKVDHAVLQGVEQQKSASYSINKAPVTVVENLLYGGNEFANIEVEESIHVSTDQIGDSVLRNSERGAKVAHALTIPGSIYVLEEYSGEALALKSTQGSIHQKKNIVVRKDLSMQAANGVIKPSVTAQSTEGNVLVIADGIVDNSGGGIINAKQGAVLATGATVNNNCGALGERSLIEGNIALVEATVGNVENTGSSIRGGEFVSVKALEDVNNVAKESRKLHGENTYTHYQAAEISGGDVYVYAKGKVHNTASIIKAAFKAVVAGDRGVLMTTRSNVYKDYDYRVDHGQLNKTYHRGEATEYGIASVEGQEVEILSSESGVTLHGVNTIAKDGTKIYAKCDVILDSHVSKEKHVIEVVKVKGLFNKTTEVTTEVEKVNIVATDTGKIHVRSEEGRVIGTGNKFLGGGDASLLLESQKGIELTLKNLNHTIIVDTKKVDFHIAGQAIIDRSQKSAMDHISAASSLIGSANTVLQSDNPLEVAANLNNLAGDASRTLAQVVGEGGVVDVIKDHITADVTVTISKSLNKMQTQGGGGISGIKHVEAVAREGDVKIGHDLTGITKMKVAAIKFLVTNSTLASSSKYVEVSASASIDATGAQNYGAAASKSSSSSIAQIQTKMNVRELVLDVDELELDGAKATVGSISGRADKIITRDKLDSSKSKSQSISVDASGNVGGSVVKAKSQEVGATGSLHVEDGIDSNTFAVKEYVSFGSVSNSLAIPEIIQTHIALDEYSKRAGGSLGGNLNQVSAASASAINLRVGIDHKDYKATVGQDGRAIIKNEKFDAKVKIALPNELFSQQWQLEQHPQLEPLVVLDAIESMYEKPTLNGSLVPELLSTSCEQYYSPEYDNVDKLVHAPWQEMSHTQAHSAPTTMNLHAEQTQKVSYLDHIKAKRKASEVSALSETSSASKEQEAFDYFAPYVTNSPRDEIKDSVEGFMKSPESYSRGNPKPITTAAEAINSGISRGFDMAVQPIMHPIDTIQGLATTTWDGFNVLSDVTLGISTAGSRERSIARGRAVNDGIDKYKAGDGVNKLEMGTALTSGILFSYGAGMATKLAAINVATNTSVLQYVSGISPVVGKIVVERTVASALSGKPVMFGVRGDFSVQAQVSQHLPLYSNCKNSFANFGEQIARGSYAVPKHKFDLWYNYLSKRGVKFEIGTSKASDLLYKNKAKGLRIDIFNPEINKWESTVVLPAKFEPHVFYEEVLHALDHLKNRPRDIVFNGKVIDNWEYRAKSFLVESSEKRSFSYEQFIELEEHLELVMKNKYPGPFFSA